MSNTNSVTVRRFHEECFNRGAMDDVAALCAPGVTIIHSGMAMDLATAVGFAKLFLAAFPDGQNVIEELITVGDTVISRGTFSGTHLGEFQGLPPTGKSVVMTWMSIDRLADGKFIERRVEQDTLGLMQQLGVFPPPA